MSRLVAAPGPVVRVNLTRDLRRAIRRGHPWIFANAVRIPPGADPGAIALVADKGGRPLAVGYVDPEGPLAIRVCATEPGVRLDDDWAAARIAHALALRRGTFDADTTGFRAINGEGDGLPGLVFDVYGDTGVLKLDGPIAERFWDAPGLAAHLAEQLGLSAVYQRHRTRGEPAGRPLVGPTPSAPVPFLEHGARFTADVVVGQKTGFFLDQRDNRARVARLARDRSVLNVFGYTGGFSIAAGRAGARQVTTVDLARPAVEAAEAHWRDNGLDPAAHEGIAADAFDVLEGAARGKRRWDLVILDPPAFAPSREAAAGAIRAYTRMVTAGAQVTEPGGLCVAASCSAHVDAAEFLTLCEEGVSQARRRATVLGIYGQPFDHPAPLACPELRYLKCVFLALD
ncbi:MAG: class I SAM-dependent rRNA methyltransferase [Deltaproteobacteria bacterium]|nr:MAG: class I SAM-dependent rRNA methyltransferase [Deltaproteobacteria bacterium]